MVVLVNYLHVMTILPSAILVDEIYVAPIQREFVMWFKLKFLSKNLVHENQGGNTIESYSHPEEPDSAITGKCIQGDPSEGHQILKNVIGKPSDDMNQLDRYLVHTYAPFVTRRSSYLIGLPIFLVRLVAKVIHRFGSWLHHFISSSFKLPNSNLV